MVFSTPIFLFGFLPIVIIAYYFTPKAWKNYILLLASLFFYAWGEIYYVIIMLFSIGFNFIFGKLIYQALDIKEYSQNRLDNSSSFNVKNRLSKKVILSIGICVNLIILGFFKYTNFIYENISVLLHFIGIPIKELSPVHLPLGISFFTFQAISYLIDVYRKETPCQKNLINIALYISLFPQLIAGPIIRYHDIQFQIPERIHSLKKFTSGVQRFIIGLSKKMLIANTVGQIADIIFALPNKDLSFSLAWIGIFCYSLQIFYDFSGYSDMAIGIGRMFGFTFVENFNYPYISQSIQEFWRRWHISLSNWFKDYLYIPLGGNRISSFRTYSNLAIVFLLCGLWHGASWNFVIWGCLHGAFLIFERAGLLTLINNLWRPIRHVYTLTFIAIAWVFFRTDTLEKSLYFLDAMFSFQFSANPLYSLPILVNNESIIAIFFAIVFLFPYQKKFDESSKIQHLRNLTSSYISELLLIPKILFLSTIFIISLFKLASSTYNPFIYFRF